MHNPLEILTFMVSPCHTESRTQSSNHTTVLTPNLLEMESNIRGEFGNQVVCSCTYMLYSTANDMDRKWSREK